MYQGPNNGVCGITSHVWNVMYFSHLNIYVSNLFHVYLNLKFAFSRFSRGME